MTINKNHQSDFAILTRIGADFEKQADSLLIDMASSMMRLTLTRVVYEDRNRSLAVKDLSYPKALEGEIRKLTKETREMIGKNRDLTAGEMSFHYPFDKCTSHESKVLLLIKEKGLVSTYANKALDRKLFNMFLDEPRTMIECDKLSKFINGAENIDTDEVLNTLTRLNLVYKYHNGATYPGAWMVELAPIGRKLVEIIQKQKNGPSKPANIGPRN